MNPTLATILGIVGTAAATAIATAIGVFGPLLAGILKLWGLTLITKMSVHSVEQTNKDDPPTTKKQLAADRASAMAKWCGLGDATSVIPTANEAHVFGLPPTDTPATIPSPYATSGEPKG